MSLGDGISEYWSRGVRRRRLLGSGLALTGSAAFLAACGSSNNNKSSSTNNKATNNTAANSATNAAKPSVAGGTPAPAGGSPAAGAAGATKSFTPSTQPAKLGGTFTDAFTGPFAGVDPHNSVYGGAGIVPQVYDYLLRTSIIAPDLGNIPQLATKYELAGDGTTMTFTLRPDAMIQENKSNVPVRPIDSEDVKGSFDRILDPKNAANGFAWTSTWIDKYDNPDKQTFRIITKKPYAWLLNNIGNNLESAIVPKEWLASADIKKNAIGSGPFTLQSVEEGNQAVLNKNPNYWDKGRPNVNSVVIKTFADVTTWRTAFTSGQVDHYIPTNVDELKEISGQKKGLQATTDAGFSYLSFWQNVTAAPWTDARIRRAVWRAMNPAEYIQVIGHGDAVKIGLVTYAMKQYALSDADLNTAAPFDIQQAKQLLSAAGQPNLTFSFQHPTSSNVIDYVNIFVRQMQAAGITAKPEPQDAGTWVAGYFSNKLTASLSLNQGYYTPEAALLWYRSGGITGNNHYDTGFHDPDIDTALDKAATTLDETARIKAYQDAQKLIISKDPPFWNFMGIKDYNVVQPEVMNFPHGVSANLAYYFIKNLWLNR